MDSWDGIMNYGRTIWWDGIGWDEMGSWIMAERFSDRIVSVPPSDPFTGDSTPGV